MKFFCKGCFPNTMHLPPPPPLPDKKFPCGGSKIGDKDFYEVDSGCLKYYTFPKRIVYIIFKRKSTYYQC